ncbi:unnamed protein product [Anisakis simplex]|uniref:DUF1618 domain-containing protein n=1 Tax=Anisakis simplex TaxID=6269 RepID=A0A0M3J5N0_ANISI|nr:unnamed protein product [Anisakis simplex]
MSYSGSRRQSVYYEEEKPRVEMCSEHSIPESLYFPHLISAYLPNGTAIDSEAPSPCWTKHCLKVVSLPPRLRYTYTLQFINVENRNMDSSRSELIVCDANTNLNRCSYERYRIPLINAVLPQSLSLRSAGRPVFISLEHIPVGLSGRVAGDILLVFNLISSRIIS